MKTLYDKALVFRNRSTKESTFVYLEEWQRLRYMAERAINEDWTDERWLANFRAETDMAVSDEYALMMYELLKVWDIRSAALSQ